MTTTLCKLLIDLEHIPHAGTALTARIWSRLPDGTWYADGALHGCAQPIDDLTDASELRGAWLRLREGLAFVWPQWTGEALAASVLAGEAFEAVLSEGPAEVSR